MMSLEMTRNQRQKQTHTKNANNKVWENGVSLNPVYSDNNIKLGTLHEKGICIQFRVSTSCMCCIRRYAIRLSHQIARAHTHIGEYIAWICSGNFPISREFVCQDLMGFGRVRFIFAPHGKILCFSQNQIDSRLHRNAWHIMLITKQ